MYKAATLALLTLATLTGCGAPNSSVSGTVTVDGSPAADLVVSFTPSQGGLPAAATTDASGKYTLSTAPGSYKIAITSVRPAEGEATEAPVDEDNAPYTGGSDTDEYAEQALGTDGYKDARKFKETIPAKYNKNTELTADITAGDNTKDFELSTK